MYLDILITNTLLFIAVVSAILTTVFVVATARHDNSIMDIAYGPTVGIAAIGLLYMNVRTDIFSTLVVGLVILWATRLAIRIGHKNIGQPEDARYAAWRRAWKQQGTLYFLLRSYVQIYLLQGAIITIVGLPLIVAITAPHYIDPTWLAVGLGIALFGLIYESIADWQLDTFIAHKKAGVETSDLMTQGLFHYSRRPNYFGEVLVWWGLAIAVLPLPYGWIALLSPLLITYIVTMVTGPMLERLFLEKYPTAYREYMTTTSYFIPLPPHKL